MKRSRILIPLFLLFFQGGVIQSQNHKKELVDQPVTSEIGPEKTHQYKIVLGQDEFAFPRRWSSGICLTQCGVTK